MEVQLTSGAAPQQHQQPNAPCFLSSDVAAPPPCARIFATARRLTQAGRRARLPRIVWLLRAVPRPPAPRMVCMVFFCVCVCVEDGGRRALCWGVCGVLGTDVRSNSMPVQLTSMGVVLCAGGGEFNEACAVSLWFWLAFLLQRERTSHSLSPHTT